MAQHALRDVSNTRRSKPHQSEAERLIALIDQAGQFKERRSEIDRDYKMVREQIQGQMEIPEQGEATVIQGNFYEAKLSYDQQTTVDLPELRKLLQKNPTLFWQLVKINVTDLQNAMSPEEFHSYTNRHYREVPTLDIRKKK